jgi:hypothetical protein
MTRREFGEVRQLYKFAIAYDCFWAVSQSCEYLIGAGTKSTQPGGFGTRPVPIRKNIRSRRRLQ